MHVLASVDTASNDTVNTVFSRLEFPDTLTLVVGMSPGTAPGAHFKTRSDTSFHLFYPAQGMAVLPPRFGGHNGHNTKRARRRKGFFQRRALFDTWR
ncbi:MAG: hypothetical protein JW818_14980, partial [Pirellulales bacterium]|nr:hypothetical protein [Pirellulales bacterium]